jgi:hypothetical protein
MNKRKIFTNSFVLALTLLITFGSTWQYAAAGAPDVYRLTAGKTIEVGQQGLYSTNIPIGVTHAYLDIWDEPLPPVFNHAVDIDFLSPALEVRFLERNGGLIEDINALVYVFFNIDFAERQLWLEGGDDEIAIWYVDERTNRWKMCPTHFVEQTIIGGVYGRLSCIAPGSGFYVLGYRVFKGYNNQQIFPLDRGKTIEVGKQGLHATNIPLGVTHVYADFPVEPLPPRFNHAVDVSFLSPVLEVRFLDYNGGLVEDISALVYVFFNIGFAERQLWREGGTDEIAIWYVDERSGRWEMCPTRFVNRSISGGVYGRLSCVAPGSGFYVLGHVEFDDLSFDPSSTDNSSRGSKVDYIPK